MTDSEEHLTATFASSLNENLVHSATSSSVVRGPNNNISEPDHRPACDRCKGQKLRCIWEPGTDVCRRCSRAQAVCKLPRPRPLGRPRRATNIEPNAQPQTGVKDWAPMIRNDSAAQLHEDEAWSRPPAAFKDEDASAHFPHDGSGMPQHLGPPSFLPAVHPLMPRSPSQPSCSDHFEWNSDVLISPTEGELSNISALQMIQSAMDAMGSPIGTVMYNGPSTASTTSMSPLALADFNPDLLSREPASNHLAILVQLGDLNVSLYTHPLHPKFPPLSTPTNQPISLDISAHSDVSATLCINSSTLSRLEIGSLLNMTTQLGYIARQSGLADYVASQEDDAVLSDTLTTREPALHDPSTIFTILGSYARLELIYNRTLAALGKIKRSGLGAEGACHQIIPQLTVDGWPLECPPAMQLDFVIYICESTLVSIRTSLASLKAKI